MKKLILFSVLLLNSVFNHAQLNISVYERIDYVLDSHIEDFTKYDAKDEVSFFEINEANTIIKHTTSQMVSNYYVEDSWVDEDSQKYYYILKSDNGNKYMLSINASDINDLKMIFGILEDIKNKAKYRRGVIYKINNIYK